MTATIVVSMSSGVNGPVFPKFNFIDFSVTGSYSMGRIRANRNRVHLQPDSSRETRVTKVWFGDSSNGAILGVYLRWNAMTIGIGVLCSTAEKPHEPRPDADHHM